MTHEERARAWLSAKCATGDVRVDLAMDDVGTEKCDCLDALAAQFAEVAAAEREACALTCLSTTPKNASPSEALIAEVIVEECTKRIRARGAR